MRAVPLGATKQAVIALLKDGEYQDGDSIGRALRMTRAAVWKTIKKLQEYGVQIESIKGKGYRLLEPLQLLDIKQIETPMPVSWHVFESLSSTNDYLRSVKSTHDIAICVAEQQTRGKGRLQRAWYAPFGKNIYLSCRYPFQKDISEMAGLSLIVGLAVVKTLNSYSGDQPFVVKWPNDVLYDAKKICGILIEMTAESNGACMAVIGIGINVNMLNDEQHISQPWISLKQITGKDVDRNQLCTRLLHNLFEYLTEFSQQGFAAFQSEWNKADSLINKEINLLHVDKPVQGKVIGVNGLGHLVLRHANGSERAYSSGDTVIKK